MIALVIHEDGEQRFIHGDSWNDVIRKMSCADISVTIVQPGLNLPDVYNMVVGVIKEVVGDNELDMHLSSIKMETLIEAITVELWRVLYDNRS